MPLRLKTSSMTRGGVGVLARQHLVAAGDQRDLGAERAVGGRELGAGDTRTDDDEVLGHLVERVELGPGEDALAVGLRGRQHARAGADRDDEGVGLDLVEVGAALAVPVDDDDGVGAVEAAVALRRSARPPRSSCVLHVLGLLAGEPQQALVDRGEVDGDLGPHGRPASPFA